MSTLQDQDITAPAWLLDIVRCPACRRPLETERGSADVLMHTVGPCEESYPVIGGIPRLVRGPTRREVVQRHQAWFEASPKRAAVAAAWSTEPGDPNAVVRHFDREWQRFSRVGTTELGKVFESYFSLIPGDDFGADRTVLDAGCGGGRWAFEVASRGPRVVALDLGFSVELAAQTTASTGRVGCVQADLLDLPVADASVDWAYSLGVLHVIEDTRGAIRKIAQSVKPQGHVLLYLYYAFDNRGRLYRSLFRLVDNVRRTTSRMPRRALYGVAFAFALTVYLPLSRVAKVLSAFRPSAGERVPLASYRDRSFDVMYNDSVDRFGTAVELRFSREEIRRMMKDSALGEVAFSDSPPFWCVRATRT